MARAASQPEMKALHDQRHRDAVCALTEKQEPSEYKHVDLGLGFLTYISDGIEERSAHPGFETVRELNWIPIPPREHLRVGRRGTLTQRALGDALLPEPLRRIRVPEAELAES
jgi:hypothetical protein